MEASQLESQLHGGDIFYTSSIHLIAYLDMKGVKYVGVNKFKDKSLFLFERNEELQKTIDAYKSDKVIQSFLTSLRRSKEVLSK